MTAAEARTHLDYSAWASRKLLNAVLELPEDHQHRDLGTAYKNVRETLHHIYGADRAWLSRVLGSPVDGPTDSLQSAWDHVHEGWKNWAASVTDADLARVIAYKSREGQPFESATWQIVFHVVNHATLHRGQVMAMFRQLGIAPPPTDLIFYYREQS